MVTLTTFQREDFPRLINWITDADMMMQWGGPTFTFPLTEEQLNEFSDGANRSGAESYLYNVVLDETSEPVGFITINSVDWTERTGKVGKVYISDEVRGRGLCPYLMKEVARVGFEELSLQRLFLGVFDFNEPAVRCYEHAGFRKYEHIPALRELYGELQGVWRMDYTKERWENEQSDCRPGS